MYKIKKELRILIIIPFHSKEDSLMKKSLQFLLLLVVAFAVYACIPVPVPVGPSSPGYSGPIYEQPYGYEDEYGYGYGYEDEYYDVPISYGEPMYFTPPVIVTFSFDYFTYELVGGYVDIVFWRSGHRYHREPWQERGRRFSAADVRTKKYHRVRAPEFYQHREKLQKNHRISHPDSYYGVKKPSRQPVQQRPQKMEQKPQLDQRQPRPLEQRQPSQIEQRPQWGDPPKRQVEQKSPVEQKTPRQIEPRSPWGQKPTRQIEQKTEPQDIQPSPRVKTPAPQMEQRPQIGQPPRKPSPQVEKKPQWGERQTKQGTLRETPQQKKQRYQAEQKKRLQEKEKQLKDSLKEGKKELEDEKVTKEKVKEESTKRWPRQ
jgi:hypothetical protein